jgi:hypothetical protein
MALLNYYLRAQCQARILNIRNRTSADIPREKIIIAVEPQQLLFHYKDTQSEGFSETVLPLQGWARLWAKFLRLFGKGHFYRVKESRRNAVQFLNNLTANGKVQLYLYTTLPLSVAE